MNPPVTTITGLISLVGLCFFCVQCHRPTIESDLGSRSRVALQTAGYEQAKVTMAGRDLTLSGEIASEADKKKAEAAAASVVGIRVVNNTLSIGAPALKRPAPVAGAPTAEVNFISTGEGLTLTGTVPDEATREALVKNAETTWAPLTVTDELTVLDSSPDSLFAASAVTTLIQLHGLLNGEARVTSKSVRISGLAPASSGGGAAVEGALKDMLAHVSVEDVSVEVNVKTELIEADCQGEVNALLKGKKINFASSSAVIDASSDPLLTDIAEVLKRCPDSIIRVEGHTDATGAAADNLALSDERAEAVREHMTGLEIAAGRVKAKGFGEAKPIADNTTVDGRAANRRIEFKLQGGK